MADPIVSSRYQFWYLVYNTGNPIAYSGWLLRDGLDKLVHELDPQGKDPALRDMVVIGHSEHGLVTNLAAVDGGTVVAYKSAYLPGMESQNVVHCAHGVAPADPVAIDDIRHILLHHFKETGSDLSTK
jgi:hypothetical protein